MLAAGELPASYSYRKRPTDRGDQIMPHPSQPVTQASTETLLPSSARRLWNQVLTGLTRRRVEFVYSTDYQVDLGITPIDSLRAQRILTYLISQAMVGPKAILRPEPASIRELQLVHTSDYLEALRKPASVTDIVGFEIWPDLHEQLLQAQRASVGGTLLATQRAVRREALVVNLGGGLHHAGRSSGRGFCVFNDVAVAIVQLRNNGFDKPILVVDLDLHDGNGTREIFAEDDSVFTFSIHNQDWSREPARASLSIELPENVGDTTYLAALREQLPAIVSQHRPGLIFYLAGTDPAHDDAIGNWSISTRGMLERDRFVVSETHEGAKSKVPLVVLLAGGYGNETWRYSARFLSWLVTNSARREPPSTTEMTLARYRHLSSFLSAAASATEDFDDWGLSDTDITGDLGPDAGHSLFLGHYSRHALELAMQWTGLFDRLRSRGFYHPYLDIDLSNPNGHTLRMYSDSRKKELLVEARLRIDRNIVADAELLSIEWLLMQNPRAEFSAGRPRLPQQSHPGLGLVSDIVSLLILICDRLKLDGLVFIPSHFHLVRKAGKHLHFLRREDERWYQAVERAVHDRPIAEATEIVARGALRDRQTGETIRWRPMPMVLAVSDRFKQQIEEGSADGGTPLESPVFEVVSDGALSDDRVAPASPGSRPEHR